MASISPHFARMFVDSPEDVHRRRENRRNRIESKGRVAKRRTR